MTNENQIWVERVKKEFISKANYILDVGSLNVNGEVRQYFKDAEKYFGIDMRKGDGVDIIMRGDEIQNHFAAGSIDLVICMNTLEHDDNFWETVRQMKKVLEVGGHMIISVPTMMFPIHDHPSDYWRFSEEAIRKIIFKDFDILDLEHQDTVVVDGKGVNPVICAIGRKKQL